MCAAGPRCPSTCAAVRAGASCSRRGGTARVATRSAVCGAHRRASLRPDSECGTRPAAGRYQQVAVAGGMRRSALSVGAARSSTRRAPRVASLAAAGGLVGLLPPPRVARLWPLLAAAGGGDVGSVGGGDAARDGTRDGDGARRTLRLPAHREQLHAPVAAAAPSAAATATSSSGSPARQRGEPNTCGGGPCPARMVAHFAASVQRPAPRCTRWASRPLGRGRMGACPRGLDSLAAAGCCEDGPGCRRRVRCRGVLGTPAVPRDAPAGRVERVGDENAAPRRCRPRSPPGPGGWRRRR